MRRIHLEGALLFAFIPLVLFLYLARPLGPGLSLAAGVALMLGHRFVAAPWMARHATERCLWCGRAEAPPERFEVTAAGRAVTMAACGPEHRDLCGRFLTFVHRRRRAIAAGIFVPLALLLAGTLAEAAGRPFLAHEANALVFRIVVAVTVVTASLAWLSTARPDATLRSPFPLHNLFLLGIRSILWVFRGVGLWWLATGIAAAFTAIFRA